MSVPLPFVPEGFATTNEALERAYKKWGEAGGARLVSLLVAGEIPSSVVDAKADVRELSADFWRNPRALYILEAESIGWDRDDDISKGRPLIPNAALNLIFLNDRSPSQSSEKAPSPSKGGHPEDYDWEAMWIEIVWIMREEGLPSKSVELRKRMQGWFEERFNKSPSDNSIQPKIKRLFERLDKDE